MAQNVGLLCRYKLSGLGYKTSGGNVVRLWIHARHHHVTNQWAKMDMVCIFRRNLFQDSHQGDELDLLVHVYFPSNLATNWEVMVNRAYIKARLARQDL
jgi:hypothetical protein